MKANELRIGNCYDQFGNINQVDWITIKELSNAPDSQLWCKAIPLTEEWLLKFGFEKKEGYYDRYYYSIDGMNIKIDDDMFETEVGECLYKSIKYVHQLQNLFFAINDEELTMK